ncbi:hypothetical protein A2334_01505 [Candidatus Roizmanbacteria bacterium RIFOXYB2_FULL_38_10]|uniref:Uncharacterized protein n=1 Tax=Candidatus Roizmanbacteria bacterium RIFOXYD1_FULL_38_12 TaxID=1802093 RepID=A0A1F7L221_9BACT|nr:MAG: hypothetical protein A3K47_05555 [Candidatus Roizmanbacteria bacterium RIFOXYA2_FULL_38_14]OGK64209.1 MAG: hypothetical protein A3K27_05555 [Candidatus Roizmanbacteria bacterium RIFOXYA1_FULL_37_12]OGK66055.1 MAG: hypothetical protein A3K38_05555 [Candidatus Roizmanbacteria bacterium RIFOXYB1_FULL_40_23]OGK68526.1 MAG: hypothetical protein A2334_01505 [Candidatus Roizmanbacteria bacterium RIFOXYB2_FULL_38_10]OGK70460.1 MAG: hypothetical protein A3K21_05560 [Candidatus Roizmanbacteria ba
MVERNTRQRVKIQGANGITDEIYVPFTPEDRIHLDALFPYAMIMLNYAQQKIAVYPHGTDEETIIYEGKLGQPR